ncbi:hypothetical protein BS47DRAFT_1362888 [Hydnum rufescens UP504]|uniref:Uncharacterized protein n=1 Tax=Hydnum rufescens UP504 TaxID=1448309 RepID=A0A9P6DVN1_9AGAM|nr:hypothetical protein BS47DRAFT_1362888 [Hydnum rufescens UP504]
MAELERALKSDGILFSAEGNRIWCFPHIINISVQHILALLKTAKEGDIVAKVCALVNNVRSTGDCHIAFMETIQEGNNSDEFEKPVPEKELLWESKLDGICPIGC